MRSSRIAIALLLCVCVALGGASVPARAVGAGATPLLMLEPNQAPCGATIVARGSGFPAGTTVEMVSTRPISPPPQRSAPVLTTTVGADGSFARDIVPCDPATPGADQEGLQYRVAAGTPTVDPFADHEAYASAVFAVGPVGQRTLPTLTLTPESGACNSPVVAIGANWFPGDRLSFAAFQIGGNQGLHFADAWVGEDGTFSLPFEMHLATLCSDAKAPPLGAQYYIGLSQHQHWNYPRLDSASFIYTITRERLTERCFRETGLCVHGAFFERWDRYGLVGNGYPISPAYTRTLEDGTLYLVQYFERVRMEFHPENAPPHDILLGQFGRRILAGVPDAPTAPVAPQANATFFAETGHNVGERFMSYWQSNGGLDQFGYPLTEAFEQQLEDGKTYIVQYFERARFEHHPENAPPYDVLLGQFGRQILAESR